MCTASRAFPLRRSLCQATQHIHDVLAVVDSLSVNPEWQLLAEIVMVMSSLRIRSSNDLQAKPYLY